MTLQKLNIQPKVDNAAKKQMVTSNVIGTNETLLANEVNDIVNKVNEVVEAYNFGAPITAFNFKENVPTYADLPLVGNEINDGYGVIADGLVYVWNGTAFPPEGQGMDLGLVPDENSKVEDGNLAAVNGHAINTEINGGDSFYGNKNLSAYNSNISSGIHTVIMSDVFKKKSIIKKFNCYAFASGKIKLKTFTIYSNTVTMVNSTEITLTAGLNDIDISSLGITIPEGGLLGYSANNADLLGRIGYSSSDTKGNYYITSTDNNSFVLPSKATTNGIGFNIVIRTEGLSQEILKDIKSTDLTTSFVSQIGALHPDYNSIQGYMKLDFTAGNQSVKLPNTLILNEETVISFCAKVTNGSEARITLGLFSGTLNPPVTNLVTIDSEEKTYKIEVKGSASGDVSVGLISVNNLGQDLLIKDFKILKKGTFDDIDNRLQVLENNLKPLPQAFNLETALFSLSKVEKKLTKIGVLGDSLMANATGGVIPDIEPIVSERPIRLGESNTISRRLYDLASWNKPTWKRLDNSSWVKIGVWTAINTTNLFEPIYANETYHSANSGAEATITVPQGEENFALVLRTGLSSGTVEIYLNGMLNQTLDTLKLTAGHTGNPYKTIEILDMPIEQDNVIRIVSKSTNTFPIYVWGGFFWSGNTIMVYNVAHGGHTLQNLIDQHINDEVVDNNFDAILFEHTLMNDTARMVDSGNTIEKSVLALKNILDTKINGKDILTFSCQPYGIDPQDGTPNYYINYPGMEEMKNALKKVSFDSGVPYIDVFDIFKNKIENRNGTLQEGQGGLFYTWDGQHQNKIGMDFYWSFIKSVIKLSPIFD